MVKTGLVAHKFYKKAYKWGGNVFYAALKGMITCHFNSILYASCFVLLGESGWRAW
jgi:hypothetical protein